MTTSHVSVVVVTRDRPRQLEVCLAAILMNTLGEFELIVVDQSTTLQTAKIVERLERQDPRVRLVGDYGGKGAARARNIGAAEATGEIVVFTDDDCEPAPDWLVQLVVAMRNEPAVGIAYGAVVPALHDPEAGFIVGFNPHGRRRLAGRLAKLRDNGISANVALRRSALVETGGFDEMLGPGSYFPCAEDYDLAYRVLARKFALLHVPEARVVHHGLRDWSSGSDLIHATYVAIGAAYMKHIRLRDPVGLLLLGQELLRALGNIAIHLLRRRGPFGFGRLHGLLLGALKSFELNVEQPRTIYSLRMSNLRSSTCN